MNRFGRPLSVVSALLISIVLASAEGRAAEEPPVVRALLDSVAIAAASRPAYGSLEVAADGTVTLSNLTATFEADGEAGTAMTYEVETLVLADVKEVGEGLFEVGKAEWSQMTVLSDGQPLAAVPLITGTSVYLHQPGDEPTALERIRATNIHAKQFLIPEALVLTDGHSIMVEGLSTTWQGDPASGAGTTQFTAGRIHVPGGVFEDGDNPFAAAGYEELELAITGTAVTAYTDKAVGFDLEMRLDGRDMGSLIIDLGADGIPLALFGAFDPADADADTLLPFADGVSFKRARIRFEDASLTTRLLALMADAEDMDVETFVAGITDGVEIGLEEFFDRKLAQQVSASLSTFLNDPKALTLALAPKVPVSFDQILAGLEDPLALMELLQVSVTAND